MQTKHANTSQVIPLRSSEGCVAYLLIDLKTRKALAIDARLDQVEQLIELAKKNNVTITAVIDTHTHADHLSGARLLAKRTHADLLTSAASKLEAHATRIPFGSTFKLGELHIHALKSTGHTQDSLALHADNNLFTGDALFIEGTGRTDFPGGSPKELIETLNRFEKLAGDTIIHPGHDYQNRTRATIAQLKQEHPLLKEHDMTKRIELATGKGRTIPDISQILSWNNAAEDGDEIPPKAVRDMVNGKSATLIDVRTPAEFAQANIRGSKNIPLAELEKRLHDIDKNKEVIITCRTGMRAKKALGILRKKDIQAKMLKGCLEGWRAAGLELDEKRKGMLPIDQQVQLIAGTMNGHRGNCRRILSHALRICHTRILWGRPRIRRRNRRLWAWNTPLAYAVE